MLSIPIKADTICAIVPDRVNNRASTIIIDISGNKYDVPRRVKYVLRYIAWYFAVDLEALKKGCSEMLGRKLYLPIPFKEDMIMMPLKLRQHEAGEETTGYVNYCFIDLKECKGQDIVLRNGVHIKCYNSMDTVYKHLKSAESVLYEMFGDIVVKERNRNYICPLYL